MLARIVLFAFCAIVGASPVANAAEREALIIGNGAYRQVPRLPNPSNDADDMAAALKRLNFNVHMVKDASYETMRLALLDFAPRAQQAEMAVIFYAGHGIEVRDENWLIPVDANLKLDVTTAQEAIALRSV